MTIKIMAYIVLSRTDRYQDIAECNYIIDEVVNDLIKDGFCVTLKNRNNVIIWTESKYTKTLLQLTYAGRICEIRETCEKV
jgi:hypothetical protein